MNVTRRRLVTGSVASLSLALAGFARRAQSPTTLKISHQFPGGTIDQGDFRDRLCRRFGQEVEKRTNGALKFEIYPNSSLVKVNTQFSAMRRGALDLSLVPLSYSGGEVAETNIGLLPALVPSYEVGSKWKNAEVGKLLSQILAEKGIVVVSWIWQAGGVASRGKPLVQPEDAKGMKVRGGSRRWTCCSRMLALRWCRCLRMRSTPRCRPVRWTRRSRLRRASSRSGWRRSPSSSPAGAANRTGSCSSR
jgi:TRAP-type C4-dicarboxylate transport system substrate-binding protein